MSEAWTDPGSLEGDALTRWYRRSPADIERERQAAAARRYQDFFHGGAAADPGSGRGVPASSQDIDPGFSIPGPSKDIDPGFAVSAPPRDIDPGFSWAQVGPNRWRSVRTDEQANGPSLPAASFGNNAASTDRALRSNVSFRPVSPEARQVAGANPTVHSPSHLAPATPPLPTFFSSLFGGPVPLTSPEGHVVGYYDHQAAKAGLGITAQYAQIAQWLQPAGWMDGLIAGGGSRIALAGAPAVRAVQSGLQTPLNFLEREAWQGKTAVEQTARDLWKAAEPAVRRAARSRFAQANGISASKMGGQVHHSATLEYAHLMPGADPNRLANLWGLPDEVHQIASYEWTAFRAGLKGRIPSQAEIMAVKLRIDQMVAPYVLRAGIPRPGPTPK